MSIPDRLPDEALAVTVLVHRPGHPSTSVQCSSMDEARVLLREVEAEDGARAELVGDEHWSIEDHREHDPLGADDRLDEPEP